MIGWLFAIGAGLVIAGWWMRRRRLTRLGEEGVTDAMLRRIEASGHVELDEPLDLEEAAEEERRFWEETWDSPEQY